MLGGSNVEDRNNSFNTTMSVTLQIPLRLARYAGDQREFHLEAESLTHLLNRLCHHHPDLRLRLLDGAGKLYPYFAILHNEQRLMDDQIEQLIVSDGDYLEIMTLASGG